jgi:hypothetical protein
VSTWHDRYGDSHPHVVLDDRSELPRKTSERALVPDFHFAPHFEGVVAKPDVPGQQAISADDGVDHRVLMAKHRPPADDRARDLAIRPNRHIIAEEDWATNETKGTEHHIPSDKNTPTQHSEFLPIQGIRMAVNPIFEREGIQGFEEFDRSRRRPKAG